HGSVISDNHARNAFDIADACHDSRCRNFSPLLVHLVSSPETDLEKRGVVVEQMANSFAHRQASHLALTLMTSLAATFTQHSFLLRNRRAMRAQHFTRARSRHMPEPRLICETGRIKQSRSEQSAPVSPQRTRRSWAFR